MLPDYHLHTSLCRHATGTARAYKAVAQRRGLPEIAFTDHMPNPDGHDPDQRMTLEEWSLYQQMVMELQAPGAPRVLFGGEADYYEGCERFLRPFLASTAFDVVIGSIHCLGDWCFDNPAELQRWAAVDVEGVWRAYFELLGRFAGSGLVDVVGHLDLPKKFGHRPGDHIVRELAQPALDRIAAAELCIEINTAGLRKPVQEIYPSAMLLALARERNISICFGSDAHRPEEVGYNFEAALRLAKEAGYTEAVRFAARRKTAYPLP